MVVVSNTISVAPVVSAISVVNTQSNNYEISRTTLPNVALLSRCR